MGLHEGSIFEVRGTIIFIIESYIFLLFEDDTLLKAVAIALNDFSSFDQMSPVAYLLEVGDHNVCSVISRCLIQYIICLVSNVGKKYFCLDYVFFQR